MGKILKAPDLEVVPGYTSTTNMCTFRHKEVHSNAHNKTNLTKLTKIKGRNRIEVVFVGDVIAGMVNSQD